MQPIFSQEVLDFTKRSFAVCIAESLREANEYAGKRLGVTIELVEVDYACNGLCVAMSTGACVMLFSYSRLTAALICHEVTHATDRMFRRIGIRHTPAAYEAYAYHNEMLFSKIAKLLAKHKVTIPLV